MDTAISAVSREKARGFMQPFDKDLRAAFWAARETDRRKLVRKGSWAGIIVYVIFGLLDVVVVPDAAHLTIAGRIVSGALGVTLIEMLFRRGAGAEVLDIASAFCLFVVFGVWIATASMTHNQHTFSTYVLYGNVFMASATLFFAYRLRVSLIVCSALLLVMVSALYESGAYQPAQIVLYSSFFLTCFVFTLIVNLRMTDERYRVFLNELEAKFYQAAEEQRGEQLHRQSRTDYLTGVENRRSLDEGLAVHWAKWRDDSTAFAVALIDVDHFKKFNDGHGHVKGDDCLKSVAKILGAVVQSHGGRLGRYGGEEFMAIVPVAGEAEALAFGGSVRAAIENSHIEHGFRLDGVPMVTVSVGMSYTGFRVANRVEQLVAEADQALYAAKEAGRNSVIVYDANNPLHNDSSDRVAGILKQALGQALLSLAYQPIVDAHTGEVKGFEALMRLQSPEGQSVSPAEFIPVAERTGAIVPLGKWAIHTVCRDLLAPGIVPLVSVNVSAIQLKLKGFSMQVAKILLETKVPGHRLALEITEGLQLEIDADVLQTIGELKDLGVRIWLDDFGTGFAGLSWLRTIEFDKVKIDKSFLHDADRPEGRMLLEDIITLIRRRGARILMEGVETKEQLEFSQRSGVDEVQGYHLGRPGPIDPYKPKTAPNGARPASAPALVIDRTSEAAPYPSKIA
ncbi:bifunctional diguanylate cyclase/phosphodiesterase [Aureimonas sp. SK2]|uniref:putative bifunctional diguanylate cyclase/phosphodiesterase n=1 Tax=Aureimonas sp. SK2 TaxID=3015992 RepID=UPI0024437A7F|nr:GGDEF domain-containing phosphodiesterase [Aureimonas sp. SK2]